MFANMKQAYIFITKTNIKKSLLTLFDINKIEVSTKCDFYVSKKASEAFNVYFSNKLRLEQKLYYCRPGLITREIKMRDKFLTQQLLA